MYKKYINLFLAFLVLSVSSSVSAYVGVGSSPVFQSVQKIDAGVSLPDNYISEPVSTSIAADTLYAYALDRVVEGFTGDTVRLKRLSDNAESDFGFDSVGALDLSAINTWRSGADVDVVKLYDQMESAISLNAVNQVTLIESDAVRRFGTDFNTQSFSGSKTTGSAVISSISDTTMMGVGMAVSGAGIPTGAYILTVDSATQITISANCTATETSSFVVENGQLQRSATNGGVAAYLGDDTGYFQSSSALSIDATGGLEFHMLYSHDERKVGSGAVATDPFAGNSDDEYIMFYGADANNYIRQAIGLGSSVDYYRIRTSADTNLNVKSASRAIKQYGQLIYSFAMTPTTYGVYTRGGKPLDGTLNAATQTDIAGGSLDNGHLLVGNIFNSGTTPRTTLLLNGIFGGIIITGPLTDAQRFQVQSKLNAVGQQHRINTVENVSAYFDEIVLHKNVNASTGVVVGENSLLTLNHNHSGSAVLDSGTPSWDYEYVIPNVGVQGVRTETTSADNAFIASDNYFAKTLSGTVIGVYFSETSGNNLPVAFTQTGGTGLNKDGSRSLALGFDHSQISFETKIAASRDTDSLIGSRHKADETAFSYDMSNQEQAKYNFKTAHGDFVYDETYDTHVWSVDDWRNDGDQPYDLDGPVVAHTPDNISYPEKDNSLIIQIGTFEEPSGYDWDDAYSTRKTLRLGANNKSFVSDGTTPLFNKDGSYANNPYAAVCDSEATAKIASETGTSPYVAFTGTRVALFLSSSILTVSQIEEVQVNMYKFLIN